MTGRCTRRELGLLLASFVVLRRGLARADGALRQGAAAAPAVDLASPTPTLEALLARCDGCVAGRSVAASASWIELGGTRRIATVHRFVVERALDGTAGAGEELLVRTLGGRIGEIGQRVIGEAVIAVGEPQLLLLTRAEPGVFVVTGMEHGRFALERGEGGVMRIRADRRARDASSAAAALAGATLEQAERILAAARWGRDAR